MHQGPARAGRYTTQRGPQAALWPTSTAPLLVSSPQSRSPPPLRLLALNWPLFCGRFLVPVPSRRRGSKDPCPAQRSAVPISQKLQVNQVIPGRENHQHQNESETNAEPDFLRALAERTPSDGLDAVEQKMTAIEHRYREQIEQPNTHRDDGRKIEQRDKASARNLT